MRGNLRAMRKDTSGNPPARDPRSRKGAAANLRLLRRQRAERKAELRRANHYRSDRSPKGKARIKRYNESAKRKAALARYRKTQKWHDAVVRYNKTAKARACQQKYCRKPSTNERKVWHNRSQRRYRAIQARKL